MLSAAIFKLASKNGPKWIQKWFNCLDFRCFSSVLWFFGCTIPMGFDMCIYILHCYFSLKSVGTQNTFEDISGINACTLKYLFAFFFFEWVVKGYGGWGGSERVQMQAAISLQFHCFYSNTDNWTAHPHTHAQAIHIPMPMALSPRSFSLTLSRNLLLSLSLAGSSCCWFYCCAFCWLVFTKHLMDDDLGLGENKFLAEKLKY